MAKQSEIIAAFIRLVNQTKNVYNAAYQAVNTEDQLTSDLLHEMELNGTTSKIRGKIATELRTSRLDRRYYKDIVEELEPLYEFLGVQCTPKKDGDAAGGFAKQSADQENEKAIKKLEQVLGKMRKAEAYHADRTYHPRVNRMEETEEKEST